MLKSRTRIPCLVACVGIASVTASTCASAAEESDRLITAHDLATLTDLDGLAVSPGGRWAAFQTRRADPETNRHEHGWYVIATTGGGPRRIADGGEVIQPARGGRVNGVIDTPEPVWSTDSQWIAYLRRDNGRTQIWRSRVDEGRNEQLTHHDGDVDSVIYSADGRKLLFETRLSQPQLEAGFAEEARSGFRFDDRFSPSYSSLPFEPASGVADARELWAYDFASRRERRATDAERAELQRLRDAAQKTGVSPSGTQFRVETVGQERRIAVQPHGVGKPIACGHVDCVASGLRGYWWRNEHELIYARRVDRDTTLYSWRVSEAAPRRLLTTPHLLVARSFHWTCRIGGDRLFCFREQSDYPRQLVAVNLDNGEIEVLYDPNPRFAQFNLGSMPQHLDIRTETGVETSGYLVLPPTHRPNERLPLVIVTYRCSGFLRGGTGDEYPIYPLAAQGFAVLCYDIPTEDEARRRELGDGFEAWSRGPGDPIKHRIQQGLDAAVAQLDASGLIDPERVGLTGLSYGAETVMFALFNMKHLAAGIASGSEIGPSSTFLYSPAGREMSLRPWGLDRWDSPRWDVLSITRNAERVRAPLLLNVSDHEMLSALHPYTSLEQAGRAVEMYVFPDSYHIKHQPAHRLAIYNRNIDWMNFWLRGVEDPAPSKADQYKRWRAMRAKQCQLFKGEDAPWYCQQ